MFFFWFVIRSSMSMTNENCGNSSRSVHPFADDSPCTFRQQLRFGMTRLELLLWSSLRGDPLFAFSCFVFFYVQMEKKKNCGIDRRVLPHIRQQIFLLSCWWWALFFRFRCPGHSSSTGPGIYCNDDPWWNHVLEFFGLFFCFLFFFCIEGWKKRLEDR